jgi:hypothetical protein
MEHRRLNMIFCECFPVLLEVHIGQLGITFGKHAGIQLNDGKKQICSKNLETSRRQLKCVLLHVKMCLGYIR